MTSKHSKRLKPQTVIFSKGYDPQLSEGAAVPPVFRTSTFVFKTAEQGKRAFEIAYGIKPLQKGEKAPALIYTRVNNPNCEMVEDKIVCFDECEAAALFSSGMGAISSTCLANLKPGDTVIFADPVYGGTEYLFRHILPIYGIKTVPFHAGADKNTIENLLKNDPSVKIIYMESPANPTMVFTDIEAASSLAKQYSTPEKKILTIVDNTFLGPIFCNPFKFGADIVLYSATKFIGGHSDIIAGIALSSNELMGPIKAYRTILGSNSDPDTAWLILRSLGTLDLRMRKQQENTEKIVKFLLNHKAVESVAYPGLKSMGEDQVRIFNHQCSGAGSVISFNIQGGEKEAFDVLNNIHECRLAVSLGGIESLIEHPYSMTHSDMTAEEKDLTGITQSMIRLSVGLEDVDDLINDLNQALSHITIK